MASGEILAILAAAIAAGAINAVVGSGSLITFPTLLAFGFPPVIANVSNNIGLVPGNVSSALGYREELSGQRGRLIRLGIASCAGSLAGACALLALPPGVFEVVVPALIILACVLVVLQPRLSAWVAARGRERGEHGGPFLIAGVFLAGVYGGYFGAAQGVLVIGLLGVFLTESLQRINAGKNVLVTVVNATAAIVFVIFAHVAWLAVGLIAAGSTAGGLIGAKVGRRLPPLALRIVIVVIGVVAAVKLIFFS
ncbi:MAG TPA: sulfite exporter TauE/SafE family protein [Streptosporangiaceae bacterium]|nr:sulfite exporter TauE/SafE family protein [Streptosporangiaceae bacterium]HUZ50952.1 sulfite exporter TauE/SafE family protein [Streptosporangiaceae bacterium]